MKAISISKVNYCQFLIINHENYIPTCYAEHAKEHTHDATNRFITKPKYSILGIAYLQEPLGNSIPVLLIKKGPST